MNKAPFHPTFAITTEVNGETVHGRYWPAIGGIRVSYTNAAGETSRNWASSAPTPAAQSALARIVLRELVEAQFVRPPRDTQTLHVRAPADANLEVLAARIAVQFGVVRINTAGQNFTIDVEPRAVARVTSALADMVELQHSGPVIIRHIIAPTPRKVDSKTGDRKGD